jgi:ribose/xylose/arabinose/galactoside ABC-type transport system permease subunit
MAARKRFALVAEFGVLLALIAEMAVFSFMSPYFFTSENILNVSLQTSIIAIIAAGMTFVILTAGIDLSVGSVVAFTGVIATTVIRLDLPFPVAIAVAAAAAIGIGTLSGAVAGALITKLNITPFIVTLALMTIWRGAAFLFTDGRPIWDLPEQFSSIAGARVIGVPVPTIVMLAVFAAGYVLLTRTPFGRYVYAVGGNKEAARLAGIRTDRVILGVYVLCGFLAAVSGILLASRLNSGQPNSGLMYELDVIAAVVVGGTSLMGGRGSIVGTFVGAMLIGVLRNGLNLLNVSSYLQMIFVGAVILLAVALDRFR